jgi:hypothetical protein
VQRSLSALQPWCPPSPPSSLTSGLGGRGRRTELATKYIKTLYPTVSEELVNLSLTFVLLSFFFGPVWARLSGGGEMNPSVLSMKWSMGKTGLFDWLAGCVCIVMGYVMGFICAAAAIDVLPSLPHPRSVHHAPLQHTCVRCEGCVGARLAISCGES